MKIAIAQTKPVTGDLENNVMQILEGIKQAQKEGAELVIFPETAITGYCCGALYEQADFVGYNKFLLEEIVAKAVPDSLTAVVGFVDIKGVSKSGRLDISNSAAVISGGKVIDVYDKIILANDDHHEDRKYFTPGSNSKVTPINGKYNLGVAICEDAWSNNHDRDIVGEMKGKGADLVVCINQSYFYYGKQKVRHELFRGHAKEKQVPVVAVNAVGVGDIVKNIMIYDGGSLAYDRNGNLAAELPRFREGFKVVDIPLDREISDVVIPKFQEKYEEIFDALVFEQGELFKNIGIRNAQVHVSGGIDSAVVAVIAAEAMGKEHTVLISNPTNDNGRLTRGTAQYIADKLGIRLYWNSTQEPYESVVQEHLKAFGDEPTLTGKACIQAVLRTVQGIGAYHTFKSGIVATGNHTEIVEGWSTFHDIGSIGVHAPIGDLTKLEVFGLARYINKKFGDEIIPADLYNGTIKPAAELADANEDPIDYWVRSGIDAEMVRHRKSINDLVDAYSNKSLDPDFFPLDNDGKSIYEKYSIDQFTSQVMEAFENSRRSVFKCAQGAPIVIISPRSRGFSNRETIINHYQGWYNLEELAGRLGK